MLDEREGQTTLIPLFDRLAAGDASAADKIIEHSMERLKQLAHKRLRSFPEVQRLHQTNDIVQGAAMRLFHALKVVTPTSVGHLVRLAAVQIRRELMDLKRSEVGVNEGRAQVVLDPAQSPSQAGQIFEQLAEQTDDGVETQQLREEFHEQAGNLPEEERAVFEMIFYQGLTQKEAAHVLGVSESTVKRRWYDAQDLLHKLLSTK